MRRTTAALALAAVTVLAAPAAAQAMVAPGTQPMIHRMTAAKRQPSTDTVALSLTYRCTDRPGPAGTTNYLQVNLTQPGSRSYQVGERNNNGGLYELTCTGRNRTAFITLQPTAYNHSGLPQARPGTGMVSAQISVHATPDAGGWYTTTGQTTSRTTPARLY